MGMIKGFIERFFERLEYGGYTIDEMAIAAGGGKSPSTPPEREPTKQELKLLETQTSALENAMDVAADQYNLSASDRDYFDKIYRGSLDKNDPAVINEVKRRLGNTKEPTKKSGESDTEYQSRLRDYNSSKDQLTNIVKFELGTGDSVDTLLFDAIKQANPKTQDLMSQWESSSRELGNEFIQSNQGLSDTFKQQLTLANEEFISGIRDNSASLSQTLRQSQDSYSNKANEVSQNMGTADSDVLARTTGQNLAGIASSFQQSQDQLLSTLGRRGIAGSGIEASALGTLAGQQANTQANALNQSYIQAIQQSDAMRQAQLGIAGQVTSSQQATAQNIAQANQNMYGSVAQAQQGLAGQVFNTQAQQNQSAYGINSQLNGQILNQQLAGQQQNIANLQLASGAAQGIYGGASNMLAGAGQTANQSAQISGNTATSIGATDAQYKSSYMNAQAEKEGAVIGAVAGLASAGIGYAAMSGAGTK